MFCTCRLPVVMPVPLHARPFGARGAFSGQRSEISTCTSTVPPCAVCCAFAVCSELTPCVGDALICFACGCVVTPFLLYVWNPATSHCRSPWLSLPFNWSAAAAGVVPFAPPPLDEEIVWPLIPIMPA